MKRIDWWDLASGDTGHGDGAEVEIDGWLLPAESSDRENHFLLSAEPPCCCPRRDPSACIEVFARSKLPHNEPVRLAGRWHDLVENPTGWRFQLHDARPVSGLTRRAMLSAAPMVCVAIAAPAALAQPDSGAGRRAIAQDITVDMHSHAGRVIGRNTVGTNAPFGPVAAPMREGGMAAICLTMVADSPVTQIADRRIMAVREPAQGELYAWSQMSFARLHGLVREQQLRLVTDARSLHAARRNGPSAIISSEGADFLEGRLERLDEAYRQHSLRHLQLTHYRPNELGDIQTVAPVHGGLTAFGADVVRACNRLGIVVDVAHGTLDLVRRAAQITTKPLVLSHTSLSTRPPPRSRQISAEHARVIAATGGVIGVWPPLAIHPDLPALAAGIARMVEVVGVDHVGLGSDMQGLPWGSCFSSYAQLPELAGALLAVGFSAGEVRKLLGGNYARVFVASIG